MNEKEAERIATLTSGAVHSTTDNAIEAMHKAVEAAEAKTRELREATDQYIESFQQATDNLAATAASHVISCQAAIDSFQAHHLKILRGEAQEIPAPIAKPTVVQRNDLDNLASLAAPNDGGR